MNTIIDNPRPNMVPGVTKSATRLPVGAPLVADAGAPALLKVIGMSFCHVLIGATLQILRLRAKGQQTMVAA